MKTLLLSLLCSTAMAGDPIFKDAQGQPIHPTLINGTVVPLPLFPEVVYISVNNARCTATIVGPRAVITAAHCAQNGAKVTFKLRATRPNIISDPNAVFTGTATRSSIYPGKDHDIAMVYLDQEIADLKPASIGGKVVNGVDIQIFGYGCTNPGGGGGNDGQLRQGKNRITGISGYDVVSGKAPGGAALCFGDSGGPAFDIADITKPLLLGINSKGNIQDTNYNARLDIVESTDFIKAWSASNNNAIVCGITKDCGTPQPQPMKFSGTSKMVKFDAEVLPGNEAELDFIKRQFEFLMQFFDGHR
jgi:hypothetical protein